MPQSKIFCGKKIKFLDKHGGKGDTDKGDF